MKRAEELAYDILCRVKRCGRHRNASDFGIDDYVKQAILSYAREERRRCAEVCRELATDAEKHGLGVFNQPAESAKDCASAIEKLEDR